MMNEVTPAAEVRQIDEEEKAIVQATHKAIKQGNKSSWEVADNYLRLSDEKGWTQQQIAKEFKEVQSHVSYFIQCSRNYLLGDNRPRFWVAYSEVKKKDKGAHVANNTGVQEWYTPPEYIAAAREVLGSIDLDPASSDKAQETVLADAYYTKDDDGLSKSWAGRVWMNPPYKSGLVDKFADKLANHYEAGEVTAAIVLVNNATETDWFIRCANMASAVCFPDERVKFLDPEGKPGAPLQGQAILYLGDKPDEFYAAFGRFGWCALDVRQKCLKADAPATEDTDGQ